MAISGFTTIAALKKAVQAAWRDENPRRWNRTFWRESKHRCPANTPTEWLEWLLDLEATMLLSTPGEITLALESLSPGRWQHAYRGQLLERVLRDPIGLQRLKDEYQRIYSNGNATEADRVLGMEGNTPQRATFAPAA